MWTNLGQRNKPLGRGVLAVGERVSVRPDRTDGIHIVVPLLRVSSFHKGCASVPTILAHDGGCGGHRRRGGEEARQEQRHQNARNGADRGSAPASEPQEFEANITAFRESEPFAELLADVPEL